MEQMIFALLGFGSAGLIFLGGSSLRSHAQPQQQIAQVAKSTDLPEPYASIYRAGLRKGEMTVRELMRMTLPPLANADRNRAAEVYQLLEKMCNCQWVRLTPGTSYSSTRFIAIPDARGLPIHDRPLGF